MANYRLHLSIVIPSYNEAKNIHRGVLTSLAEHLSKLEGSWEVIFSDDGSNDETVPLIREFIQKYSKQFPDQLSILENIHAGKGPTVQAGMLKAQGKYRLFTDFDQSTPLNEVKKLLKHAQENYPVVIGSREIEGAHRDREPLHRHLMGRGFNLLVQILAIPGIYDTQCGFKLFSAEATEQLFSKLYVYGKRSARQDAFTGAFDVEALYLAKKYGFKIKEVPIQWEHNETDRVSPVRDSVRMLRDIFRIRIADLNGKYT